MVRYLAIKPELIMNRLKHNRSCLIVFTIAITIFTFTISGMAIASIDRNGIVPPPSLQAEPTELLTSEVSTLPPEVKTAVLNDAVKHTSKTVAALTVRLERYLLAPVKLIA